MDITEKYGKTNTVANICKAHNVPLVHGFAVADFLIHRRDGGLLIYALEWFDDLQGGLGAFGTDIRAQRDWMLSQWALTP